MIFIVFAAIDIIYIKKLVFPVKNTIAKRGEDTVTYALYKRQWEECMKSVCVKS